MKTQPLVLFGGSGTRLWPLAPETNYSYIPSGQAFQGAKRVARFVEKPDQGTAQTYLEADTYPWNSGITMVRVFVWLVAIAAWRTYIAAACQTASMQGKADGKLGCLRSPRSGFANRWSPMTSPRPNNTRCLKPTVIN